MSTLWTLSAKVGVMWEKVKVMGGKRKTAVMSDAYRLNCADFDPEDMGFAKFTMYFSFYQTFSSDFIQNLEAITRAHRS